MGSAQVHGAFALALRHAPYPVHAAAPRALCNARQGAVTRDVGHSSRGILAKRRETKRLEDEISLSFNTRLKVLRLQQHSRPHLCALPSVEPHELPANSD